MVFKRSLSFYLLGLMLLAQSQAAPSQEKLSCPMCTFSSENVTALEVHVNQHLDSAIAAAIPTSAQTEPKPNDTTDDRRTRTRSLMTRMNRTALTDAALDVNRTFIGMDIDHYATGSYDIGWGCGYRNIQMMFSAMFQNIKYYTSICESWYSYNLSRESMASITEIQKMIYNAWVQGFDEAGAQLYEYKLVNTKEWIGATEAVTLFSSLGIKTQLIDFHRPTSDDGCHPELFNWVLKYFQESKERLPLWLQRQGHSQLIIGIEQSGSDLTLLVLDSYQSPQQIVALSESANSLEIFRYGLSALRADQYQIIAVEGLFKNDNEKEASKFVSSLRVPNE